MGTCGSYGVSIVSHLTLSYRKSIPEPMFTQKYLFWLALWTFSTYSLADQIVYLSRPANQPVQLSEPVFNPNTLVANVGEKIHFVAQFGNQRPYYPAVSYHLMEMLTDMIFRDGVPLSGPLRNLLTMSLAFITVVSMPWLLSCS
jgi:hypothetical protein